jgi:hypothetical protein
MLINNGDLIEFIYNKQLNAAVVLNSSNESKIQLDTGQIINLNDIYLLDVVSKTAVVNREVFIGVS